MTSGSRPPRVPTLALVLALLLAPAAARAVVDFEATGTGFSMLAHECGDLEPRGAVSAHFVYRGVDAYRDGTSVLFFHDLDGDQRPSAGDVSIGRADFPVGLLLPPGRRETGALELVGHLPFPELPVWAMVDPDNLVAESDETNNVLLAGHPCAADPAHLVPLPDLSLAIVGTDVVLRGAPECSPVAVISARAANLGSLDPGVAVTVRGYVAGASPASASVSFPAPAPGSLVDFVIEVPFDGSQMLEIVLDDDGSGSRRGFIDECGDDANNACWVAVDGSALPASLAAPLGPALRATGHSDPYAATITGDFEWLLDAGTPRPATDFFAVFESTRPDLLDPVDIQPPLRQPRWTSATPRATIDPTVHFILIVPADECGRLHP